MDKLDAMGIIYTGENDHYLRELTTSRSIASIPVWGRYRLIDFLLSTLVNADVRNVAVITQKNYHSLMDHISGGREWDLNRKRDGLFILPPFVTRENPGSYQGNVDALHGVMPYIRGSSQQYVMFAGSTMLYKVDLERVMRYHREKRADITLIYYHAEDSMEQLSETTVLNVARGGRVRSVEINPMTPSCDRVWMGAFLIEKTLLEHLVDVAYSTGSIDFVRGVLMPNLEKLRIYGFRHFGYVAPMHSVRHYFSACLDILNDRVRREIFEQGGTVYTKVRDMPPAHYMRGGSAVHSSVADGCVIQGHIEDSVLFRRVTVGTGAQVKNSIIFQDSVVQEGAVLENVILDKSVVVRPGARIIGQESYPVVISKGVVV
ncbi:MAG: glucose-1-phosphate adenylyltransferase subunit GlgD [Christensenellales bacterium]|jgi:glucose-1-phosphate adenylyltransferase